MYKAIADAIDSQDLATAEQLLAAMEGESWENPMTAYYQARLAEAQGNLDEAEQKFRQLLTTSHSPQLVAKIRAGLGRIQAHRQAEYQAAIEDAKADPEPSRWAFLCWNRFLQRKSKPRQYSLAKLWP
ncbi:hypothetical protein NON20_10170 [Synechocystis sp. B12]|nr:hypothetical protein NON20_10170 [Synechocystis sp. B12]